MIWAFMMAGFHSSFFLVAFITWTQDIDSNEVDVCSCVIAFLTNDSFPSCLFTLNLNKRSRIPVYVGENEHESEPR